MWISSAPLRISLAGGGTDVPSYSRRFGGTALGATVDLRVTVVGRASRTRSGFRTCLDSCGHAATPEDVANPFAREALRRHWNGDPLELVSFADVPGGSGLGSSSAFSVALVAGLEAGRLADGALAEAACAIEMHGLGRPVGRQDQYLSALGGFRLLHISRAGRVESESVPVEDAFVRRLDDELLLFFTGATRDAGEVLKEQNARIDRGDRSAEQRLHEIKELTQVTFDALKHGDSATLGEVLGRHWELKRGLGARVSLPQVDRAYADARAAGATGGKLLGAGGGGFLLVHAGDKVRGDVRAAVAAHGFTEQSFRFEHRGAELVQPPIGGRPRAGGSAEGAPAPVP